MKQAVKIGTVLVLAAAIILTGTETNMAKKKAAAISKTKLKLTLGQTSVIKVKNKKAKVKVEWESENDDCAKVSKKGKVKAVGIGTTTIRAKMGKKTYSCKVTVSSGIKESDISVKYNNTVFTKEFAGKIKKISYGICTIKDRMAQKHMTACFSELILQKTTEPKGLHVIPDPNDPRGIKVGVVTPICFILADGTEYQVESTENQLGVTIIQGSERIETYYNIVSFAAGDENEFWKNMENDAWKYCEK